ncbi:MAG: hypothetical protein ACOZQL_28780 [Myxococcota bacterium]
MPFLGAFALGALISCTVTFSDDVRYSCKTDAECGGDGYVCAPHRNLCCKPSGAEVCDKVDNDCDGFVDNTNKLEVCNGEDDDCNGMIDDGIDLKTNPSHCGACNHACGPHEFCRASTCIERPESLCYDGFDDDMNGKEDCEDPSCDMRSCGAGCICRNLIKTEDLCDNVTDDDGDGVLNCADPDCVGKACRAGCSCVADGGQRESDCTDGVDNDLDTLTDCDDPDCVNQFCTPPDIYFQCTADKKCRCNGGVQIAEVGSVLCRDDVDNDCDGEWDCEETSCEGQSCSPDAGTACECAMGAKKEKACSNGLDDDGDQKSDCADPDCLGVTCARPDGDAGVCTATACN